MKQDVAVISLDAYAGQFYAQQVQELFGERITVCSTTRSIAVTCSRRSTAPWTI